MKNEPANLSRRDLMRYASMGLLGSAISPWVSPLAVRAADARRAGKTPKSCILLWMSGGPAHMETFDPKPDAPDECRGQYKPIRTSVPGIHICESLPRLASQMEHMALLRGMTHTNNNHPKGTLLMHYGRESSATLDYPTMGSIVAAEKHDPSTGLPGFVTLYGAMGGPGFSASPGSGYLGAKHAPLVMPDPTAELKDFVSPVPKSVHDGRLELLRLKEQAFNKRFRSRLGDAHLAAYEQADNLLRSGKLDAFDLSKESDETKKRYGCGHEPFAHQNEPDKPQTTRFGEGCLLARRLVEVGVPFVEVVLPFWDTHEDHWFIMPHLTQIIDAAMSALIDDLKQRGMLDDVLIVWMGEFGRTPKINKHKSKFRGPGRDHYGRAFTAVLAGGGVKTGQVIGKTDESGAEVTGRPISPADLMATICKIMGIDHTASYNPRTGGRVDPSNPADVAVGVPIADRGAKPVAELF